MDGNFKDDPQVVSAEAKIRHQHLVFAQLEVILFPEDAPT
jgi:hypothetical protein